MFSTDVERALRAAFDAHDGQVRKGVDPVPYVVHPVHVALILARAEADDETLQAAILHDVVEDCAGWTLERVEREFSSRVRRIVEDLTEDKSKSWDERKSWAVEHVPRMLPEAAAVKAADKLHNLSCLLADLAAAERPDEVWSKFKGGRERTLAMATALIDALEERIDPRLGRALRATLRDLENVAFRR